MARNDDQVLGERGPTMARLPIRIVALLAAVVVSAAACGGGASDEVVDSTATTTFVARPTINLVVNNWTASAVNVAIAEQLIERHLGYPVVPTRLDNTTEIYEGLTEGSLDAVLEIWPSAMTERDRVYFDRGDVLDIGELGPVGKIGWYVPQYVVDENPALSSWEGFDDRDVAAVFATAGTAPNGRLLGTNPDYRQYDQAIIDNLGLPLEVEFSGSEEATLAELEAQVAQGEPILLYWWSPTAAVASFDLVNVALPEVTDACIAAAADGGAGVDCDYPEDVLFKASSTALGAKAPDVLRFLERFSLSSRDQAELLLAIEDNGVRIDDAAARWIEANTETWSTWIDG